MRAKPLACLCALGACQPSSQVASSSFGTSITTTPASTSTSDSTGDSSSSGSSSSTTSTGTEDSAASSTSSTTLILDVGAKQDLDNPQPAGCKGKIDSMEGAQAKLLAAFPAFIATIESKFADFDYHIMVTDADAYWGNLYCEENCPDPVCDGVGYPCDYSPTACDTALGGGTVFNAGNAVPNKPCELASGRRYIEKGQPNLTEAFTCIAQVGTAGFNWLGAAAAAAVTPQLTGPGGCNEGFLRDDALLMVTIIGPYDEPYSDSPGKPAEWAQAIRDAKHGDENAVVMFSFGDLTCPPYDRICDLVWWYFPYRHIADWNNPNYGAGFDVATDPVEAACAAFIPG